MRILYILVENTFFISLAFTFSSFSSEIIVVVNVVVLILVFFVFSNSPTAHHSGADEVQCAPILFYCNVDSLLTNVLLILALVNDNNGICSLLWCRCKSAQAHSMEATAMFAFASISNVNDIKRYKIVESNWMKRAHDFVQVDNERFSNQWTKVPTQEKSIWIRLNSSVACVGGAPNTVPSTHPNRFPFKWNQINACCAILSLLCDDAKE